MKVFRYTLFTVVSFFVVVDHVKARALREADESQKKDHTQQQTDRLLVENHRLVKLYGSDKNQDIDTSHIDANDAVVFTLVLGPEELQELQHQQEREDRELRKKGKSRSRGNRDPAPEPEPEPEPEPLPQPKHESEPEPDPEPEDDSDVLVTSKAKRMLNLINEDRAIVKSAPLAFELTLQMEAQRYARFMAEKDIFEHRSPLGQNLENLDWRSLGENIAWHWNVRRAHESLMDSKGHRENILEPTYNKIGIGIYKKDDYFWICQIFARV